MFSTGGWYVTGSAMQRTELVGCTGARHEEKMENLNVEDYEAMHLVEARFLRIEGCPNGRVEFHGHQDTGVLFYMFTEWGLEDFCGELGFSSSCDLASLLSGLVFPLCGVFNVE
jgi:hypothetical protein